MLSSTKVTKPKARFKKTLIESPTTLPQSFPKAGRQTITSTKKSNRQEVRHLPLNWFRAQVQQAFPQFLQKDFQVAPMTTPSSFCCPELLLSETFSTSSGATTVDATHCLQNCANLWSPRYAFAPRRMSDSLTSVYRAPFKGPA